MSAGPLVQCVNIRKAVTRGAHYMGELEGDKIPRLAAFLDPDESRLHLDVRFGNDDEGRAIAEVALDASVVLECQRCLKPLKKTLRSSSILGLVPGDEQAKALPGEYEPWIAVEEIDLWEVAAEELALAVPVVAYHGDDECEAPQNVAASQEETGQATEAVASPFSVLSELLDNNDSD